jgi:hypothetical protein
MKNDKQINPPLIDRILIIGIDEEDLKEILDKSCSLEDINIHILEDYRSNHLKESTNDNYIENIPSVSIPNVSSVSIMV